MTTSTAWSRRSLTSQPSDMGLVVAGHQQRAGQQRLPRVVTNACTTGLGGIRTPTVRFFGFAKRRGTSRVAGRMNVAAGVWAPIKPEHLVADEDELAQLREVVADDRVVVFVVQPPQFADSFHPSTLPKRQPKGVARVGGIGDQRVLLDHLDHLVDRSLLRVLGCTSKNRATCATLRVGRPDVIVEGLGVVGSPDGGRDQQGSP